MMAPLHAFNQVCVYRLRGLDARAVPFLYFAAIVSLSTSLVVGHWCRRYPEARAVALVERLGGVYVRDTTNPSLPIVMIGLQATLMDNGRQIYWRGRATDDNLASLRVLPHLRVLSLVDSPVTDAGLEHLTRLPSLRELDVRGTQVTTAGVARLRKAIPQLTVIHGPGDAAPLDSWEASL